MKKLILPLLITVLALPVAAMACPGKSMGKHGAHFDKMDINGDGVISADEHAVGAAKHFSRVDANSDGKVTREEMKQYKKEMWKHHKKKCQHEGDHPAGKDYPMHQES